MEAVHDVVMPADSVVDIDFNIDDVVLHADLDYFDLGDDLAADDFCHAYSEFVANADANKIVGGGAATGGWIGDLCGGDGEGSSREGSPDSVVTTDGPLAGGDQDVSSFAAELERFLMEDNGDADEGIICADDFFSDLLADDDFNCFVKLAAGALQGGGGGEEIGDGDVVLAAREEEDEPTSRKRARHKIKGTTMTQWWGELEVTRMHLARIQVPAPWTPSAAVLLCCM